MYAFNRLATPLAVTLLIASPGSAHGGGQGIIGTSRRLVPVVAGLR